MKIYFRSRWCVTHSLEGEKHPSLATMWSWSLNQGKPPRLDGCGIPAETGNCSSTRKAAAQFQCLNVASGAALLYYAVLLRLLSLSRFAPSLRPYFVEAGIFGIRWLQLVGMLHCVQAIKISSRFAFIYIYISLPGEGC